MYYDSRFDGKFYQEQREEIKDRDGECVICGNEDANTVHHIIPRSEFEKAENAHDEENLLLVCKTPCHWDLEEMSVEEQQEFIP